MMTYSGGANKISALEQVYELHRVQCSLGPQDSAYETESRLVRPFLQCSLVGVLSAQTTKRVTCTAIGRVSYSKLDSNTLVEPP